MNAAKQRLYLHKPIAVQPSSLLFKARQNQIDGVRYLSLAHTVYKPRNDVDLTSPPLLILHGLFGSKQNSRSISKILAKDLNTYVYALDLRNHGDSPHNPVHDYGSMASDVEDFVHEHKLHSPILIGHSMGAKVAMTMALRSPMAISAVVSVDNAPADASLQSNFAKYVQAMCKIEEAGVTKHAQADDVLKSVEKSISIRQFLLTNLVRHPGKVELRFRIPVNILGACLNNMGDFPFRDPDVLHFDKPSLFIRGTRSHYVPDEMLPLIGRFFPRFELCDIDSDHWVISEKPEAFRQAVVEFIHRHALCGVQSGF